ncbi:DUF1552 domain-containing protein [Gemmata sp.]|uniref:DUF1552 domain-containing protein n=1 Tax=Gemmata sp. TaxID=1914242 RepID=UPI003F7199FA
MFIQRKRWQIDRRTFLRGTGVALGLPWLEAMSPKALSVATAGEVAASEVPRRAIFTYWGLGLEVRAFTPKETGKDYTATQALRPLVPFKDDITVMTDLRAFTGGHGSCSAMLTGVNTPRNGKSLVSVDQQLADHYRGKTRFPSLVLGTVRETGFGGPFPMTLSWSRNHTPITPENRPEVLFDKMFRVDDPKAVAAARGQRAEAGSVLDLVRGQAKTLHGKLGKDDRATLDQYFTSVREIEDRLRVEAEWEDRPKPKVAPLDFGPGSPRDRLGPDGRGYRAYARLMFDVIALAFQTDTTRVVSHIPRTEGDEANCYKYLTGSPHGLHGLTHHDEDEAKLKLWARVDELYMEEWAYFLGKLKGVREGAGTLLDSTLAAWATTNGGLGAHDSNMLPVVLCGGKGMGVKHQGHLPQKDVPLANVWQTVADRVGMPVPPDFQGGQATGVIKALV